MKVRDLLERVFSDGVLVSVDGPDLKISGNEQDVKKWLGELKEHKENLIHFLSNQNPRMIIKGTGRQWTPGNQKICSCGSVTGWLLDGLPLCPVCYHQVLKGKESEEKFGSAACQG